MLCRRFQCATNELVSFCPEETRANTVLSTNIRKRSSRDIKEGENDCAAGRRHRAEDSSRRQSRISGSKRLGSNISRILRVRRKGSLVCFTRGRLFGRPNRGKGRLNKEASGIRESSWTRLATRRGSFTPVAPAPLACSCLSATFVSLLSPFPLSFSFLRGAGRAAAFSGDRRSRATAARIWNKADLMRGQC